MAAPPHDYDALPTASHAPSWRQELRVIGVVLGFVALLEILARIVAPVLDYDRKAIHAFPQTISNLTQRAKISGAPRVVFFGNSLMLRGLDESILHDALGNLHGPAIETTKITPVGTAMLDWIYLYRRYFTAAESHPELLVVGFVAHHIHDQEPLKIRRLARHFVAKEDFPALWRTDLDTFHQLAQSALCGISALEGDQPEHQMAILYTCVADYQPGLNANHRLVEAAAARRARSLAASAPANPARTTTETFQRMQRFIEQCQTHKVKILFVAMPQPDVWPLNPDALSLAQSHGMRVLDARAIPGMTKEDFADGYHLGTSGSQKFSRWLAAELHAELTRASAPSPAQ